jgi:hypothetical protein
MEGPIRCANPAEKLMMRIYAAYICDELPTSVMDSLNHHCGSDWIEFFEHQLKYGKERTIKVIRKKRMRGYTPNSMCYPLAARFLKQ